MTATVNYVVVSPVKDEEHYVEHTLRSMAQQTVKPAAWVIVDDGSNDGTSEIVERYAAQHRFIRFVRRLSCGGRQPGTAVIRAFNAGYESIKGLHYDFVVKLDCDLSFDSDYFEKMLYQFSADAKLGIASGVYLERTGDGEWREIGMPSYHAAGAMKMIRRECFEEIGGFIPLRGWDTVDEIRAIARGWRTRHFRELRVKHLKLEGAGIGRLRTSIMHGEIYYLTGGSQLFFLLKVLRRLTYRPFLIGGAALVWGYLRTILKRKELLVTEAEARCYKDLLNSRIRGRLKGVAHMD